MFLFFKDTLEEVARKRFGTGTGRGFGVKPLERFSFGGGGG